MDQSFLKFFYFFFYFLLTIAFDIFFKVHYFLCILSFPVFYLHSSCCNPFFFYRAIIVIMEASWKRLFILFSLINFLPFAILIWIVIIPKVIPATINRYEICMKAEFLSFQKFSQLANKSLQKAVRVFYPSKCFSNYWTWL